MNAIPLTRTLAAHIVRTTEAAPNDVLVKLQRRSHVLMLLTPAELRELLAVPRDASKNDAEGRLCSGGTYRLLWLGKQPKCWTHMELFGRATHYDTFKLSAIEFRQLQFRAWQVIDAIAELASGAGSGGAVANSGGADMNSGADESDCAVAYYDCETLPLDAV